MRIKDVAAELGMEDALVGVAAPIRIAFLEGVRLQILHSWDSEDATNAIGSVLAFSLVAPSSRALASILKLATQDPSFSDRMGGHNSVERGSTSVLIF